MAGSPGRGANEDDVWASTASRTVQHYNACRGDALLKKTPIRLWDAGYGYGYYGSLVSIHEVDSAGTPLFPPLAQQAFASQPRGWAWVPYTTAGPTGPQACGLCYPSDRVVRTFFCNSWDITGPGSRANDGACDVEMEMTWGDPCRDPFRL